MTTAIDITIQRTTSELVRVKMDVEPKRVEQTSPEILAEVEKRFITKYPIAKAPTDSIAIAESPFNLVFCPVRRSNTAASIVTGIIKIVSFDNLKIVAIAIAPNATWDNPSPIKENLFNTRDTPNKEEHSAINTPTINAYLTNG